MSIYDRINEIRKSKGIKWKYLNENIPGAYSSRMTELKNGKTSLSTEQLSIVASILGTTTDYLLGNTDDPTPAGQKERPPAGGGEPIDPVTQELIEFANTASPEKRRAALEIIRLINKQGEA